MPNLERIEHISQWDLKFDYIHKYTTENLLTRQVLDNVEGIKFFIVRSIKFLLSNNVVNNVIILNKINNIL